MSCNTVCAVPTINLQGAGSGNLPCVTCIGARVGPGALQDLTEPLATHGVDPAILPRLHLRPVLTHRKKINKFLISSMSNNIDHQNEGLLSLSHLKPPDFNILSGELTLQSDRKFLLHTHVSQRSQDGHWRLCQFSQLSQSVSESADQ